MGSIFTQALSTLQGVFARSFWFGSFLPVVVFIALNLLIGRFGLGWWVVDLDNKILAEKWPWAAPIAVALVVFAYATAPLVPLCRAILDGRRLPDSLADRLRAEPMARQSQTKDALDDANSYLEMIDDLAADALGDFADARTRGEATTEPGDPDLVDNANRMLNKLDDSLTTKPPSPASLIDLKGAIVQALENNKASSLPDLDALPLRTLNWLNGKTPRQTVAERARFEIKRLEDRLKSLPRDVQPTAIGNARNLSELYSQSVYNVEFAFLWPRVQMVVPESEAVTKRVDAARALVDFAVLSLILTVVLLLLWLPMLAAKAMTPWSFLLLGIAGPLAVMFFYQLVVESQISLGELIQVVVDKYRFDVLKMLHIRAPATLLAEREIWRTLADVARGEAPKADFVWTAPT